MSCLSNGPKPQDMFFNIINDFVLNTASIHILKTGTCDLFLLKCQISLYISKYLIKIVLMAFFCQTTKID